MFIFNLIYTFITLLNELKTNEHHDIRIAGKKGFYSNIIKRIFTDIDYIYLIGKIIKIKLLKQKTPLFAIIDINNICNLHCKHCYWWLTRDGEKKELTSNDWKKIIKEKIKNNHILQTNLVGGEPLLRKDVLDVFNEELSGKFTIVTNGTFELIPYSGLINYWISIDGNKETHDKIRGESFYKIEKNVQKYVKETGKKVWISMTINSWNSDQIVEVAEHWKDLADGINFQIHTPFMENDPLWIPYGEYRNELLDKIIALKRKYPNYVIHEEKQLNLLRSPWGGDKNMPINCPNWAILVLDHQAESKTPCCLGSAKDTDQKPICEYCGMSNYSSLFSRGIHL